MTKIFNPFYEFVTDLIYFFGATGILARNILIDLFTAPFYPRLLIDQIYHIGQKSLPLVIITSGSMGMVRSTR
jgi:ABC-type transporter Mla maintaining outer membrane lipid asymmetry permease subunit MlaE